MWCWCGNVQTLKKDQNAVQEITFFCADFEVLFWSGRVGDESMEFGASFLAQTPTCSSMVARTTL